MRENWTLPQQLTLAPADLNGRALVEVLVELEQPLLVLLRDSNRQSFLGLQADADTRHVRWLHAPVSDLELEALARGSLPVRPSFELKPTLWVVDYDYDDNAVYSAVVKPADVPANLLPVAGAFLPDVARGALAQVLNVAEAVNDRLFRVVGEPIHADNAIEFSALSRLSGKLQEFWTSLADRLPQTALAAIRGTPRLALAGLEFRSVGLVVRVDDGRLFDLIATEYEDVISRLYLDPKSAVASLPPTAVEPFRQYVQAVSELKVEVMTEVRGRRPIFLSRWAADVAEETAEEIEAVTEALGTPVQAWHEGYFEMVTLAGRAFRFRDHLGALYDGKIEKMLVEKLENGQREVRVGHRSIYRASIRSQPKGEKVLHRLLEFIEPTEPPGHRGAP
jgi:hypothetical protein